MKLTWLGHATVMLELGGARLLTDPVLRTRIAHLRRHAPPPLPPGPVDGVLISHVHRDHLDRPSLKTVCGPATEAVAPVGAGVLLTALGLAAVHEVSTGDAVDVAGAGITAVPAWHEASRRPGSAALPALGYVVDRVWFAGDTDLHDDMRALRGEIDVALVPVWGWGPTLGPGHMDPERAARAVALVQPRVAVPIHWGTFLPYGSRRRDLLESPPRDFAAYVRELAPATRVTVLSPGGSMTA